MLETKISLFQGQKKNSSSTEQLDDAHWLQLYIYLTSRDLIEELSLTVTSKTLD